MGEEGKGGACDAVPVTDYDAELKRLRLRDRREYANAVRERHRALPCDCHVCLFADLFDMIEALGLGVGVDLREPIR